ncbi:ATP-binding protein [Paenibacillus sp. y28]|uniref:ATP-binding protein n=1 Tax=Paenibacillus sp. y28 TaxID=3129110 RepID=UPI00301B32BE
MSNLVNPFRKSLMMRFMGMMITFLLLVLAGAGVLYFKEQSEHERFRTLNGELREKQRLVESIANHANGIFFRARGFYAFQSEEEYKLIFAEKAELEQTIATYKQYRMNPEEQQLVRFVESFFQRYFAETLPQAVIYVRANDDEGLRKLAGQGMIEEVNNFIRDARAFNRTNQMKLDEGEAMFAERMKAQNFQYVLYLILIMTFLFLMMIKTARDFGMPLGRLSASASAFALGRVEKIRYTDRADEIGLLARSLEAMMIQIQTKEEELVAQNEELQAQQDELQMQQEELTEALFKMEENEQDLQRRNRFIRSISTTLNRQDLLKSIILNMVELMKADKGMILLLGAKRDYASFGLSEEAIGQFMSTYEDGVLPRIEESSHPYTLKRAASASERGYHLEPAYVSDIFVPVLDAGGNLIALVVLTRMSLDFSGKDEAEGAAFAKQIALSLEKLDMYEKAEGQRELTQDMLDTIQVGVQLIDRNGTTIQVNSSWKQMMGYEWETGPAVNLTLEQLDARIHSLVKHAEALQQYILDLVEGRGTGRERLIYEMTAPQPRVVQIYSEPLYTGDEHVGMLLVHRDITKEYEADQLKSEFVSTVSHELRTPLASVLGFAELLLHKQLTPERQKKYIGTIHQEANRLTSLINNFLDLQRMESRKQTYDFSMMNMADAIRETMELQRVNAPNHRFEFKPGLEDAHVNADPDKMKQVLMNVIGNAIKYSPDGGTVSVQLRREDANLCIDITDEGLGIPAEALPKLFHKFYRVDNSDRREIGGTGLGLAIVKEIMNIHGGDVKASSVYGQGSTFTLLLPLAGPAYESMALAAQSAAQGKGPVYIVEDDASLSDLLAEELTESGYHVVQFARGEEALKAMSETVPAAVVLDLVLAHGMSGWAVIEQMKHSDLLKHVPILVSSAFEEKERAQDLGARGYLVKPYQPHKLSKALLRIMADESVQGPIYVPESIS